MATTAKLQTSATGADINHSSQDDVDDVKMLKRRWEEALAKCKERMDKKDFETVEKYNSVEALLDGINVWQTTSKRDDVIKTIDAVRELSALFLAMMLGSVETAMVWGVFHLALKLFVEQEKRWEKMVEMLHKIRRKLTLLYRCASCLEQHGDAYEIKNALVEVLVALMTFWVEAVRWSNNYPIANVTKEIWPTLNKRFDETYNALEETTKHLQDLVSTVRLTDGRSIYDVSKEIPIAQLQISDDSPERCEFLPMAKSPDFYGRELILGEIEAKLQPTDHGLEFRPLIIYGIGGVGKTQIALEYAHRNKSKFDVMLWVRSETKASLSTSFSEIANAMGLPGAKEGTEQTHEQNFQLVQSKLRKDSGRGKGLKWCIIFDNCESWRILEKYWPSFPGSVLVTARSQQISKSTKSPSIEVHTFNEIEASQFFRKQLDWTLDESKQVEEVAAEKILLDKLDGLALGIQQIAALINQRQDSPTAIRDFLVLYEKHAVRFHSKDNAKLDYHHNLATVWKIAFEGLSQNAKALLGPISLVSPDSIPRDVFKPETSDGLAPELQFCTDEFDLEDAIDELYVKALVWKDYQTLSIHRLVQQAYLHHLDTLQPSGLQKCINATSKLLHAVFPKQVIGRNMYNEGVKCQLLIQHGNSLAAHFASLKRQRLVLSPPVEFHELLKNCAWYYYENANHEENLKLLEIAFDSFPSELKDTMLYAHLHNSAGVSYFELNQLDKAREHMEITLGIREACLDPDDPESEEEFGHVNQNLGMIESAAGNLDKALELLLKAQSIRSHLPIPESEKRLHNLHMNLGRTYLLKDMNEEGEEHYQLAEDIIIEKYSKTAFIYAHMQHFWGNLELRRNELPKARECYELSLKIFKDTAPLNITICAVHFKLAFVLWKLNENGLALSELEKGQSLAGNRLEGRLEIPRNLFLRALILESNVSNPWSQRDTETLLVKAQYLKAKLMGDQQAEAAGDELDVYDRLTCGYHRF